MQNLLYIHAGMLRWLVTNPYKMKAEIICVYFVYIRGGRREDRREGAHNSQQDSTFLVKSAAKRPTMRSIPVQNECIYACPYISYQGPYLVRQGLFLQIILKCKWTWCNKKGILKYKQIKPWTSIYSTWIYHLDNSMIYQCLRGSINSM